MTTHATLVLLNSDSKHLVTGITTEFDMPSANAADPPLTAVSNNPSSTTASNHQRPSHDLSRKSHDKTISGVFHYTNNNDADTGYSEHRLDQLRGIKNNSLHSLSGTASTTNGAIVGANGNLKGGSNAMGTATTRARSHSKAGSTHSTASMGGSSRGQDILNSRAYAHADGGARSPVMENAIDKAGPNSGMPAGEPVDSSRTVPGLQRLPTDSVLTQRHTLQVPRAGGSVTRPSRDFSFSGGDEAISATGRFSPTREQESQPRHRRPSLGLVRRTTRSMASDAHPDEVPMDEDAARWTEVIKQKRASRRKRREEEDDDRVIVGKKVEEGHVNWVTAYNMLTGIRFTVSRTNAKIDRDLTSADFDAKHKFSFDVTGNELTPSAKYDFKFKDYSPWVFRHLRAIFGLDPADYLMSLTSKYILSELGSPGKSGSFFYFSRDYKYIIKTIHHAEHKLLRKILRDYYHHVRDNPNTLISQFYGLHRVKIPYGRKIHFVVMNNLFPPHRDIHQTFDLKGSTIGRNFKEEDLASNPRATLKDLNWLRRDLHLEFEDHTRRLFLDQIQKDVRLLQKLHIMDYSLLVGMHDLEKGNDENIRDQTLQVFQPGGERGEDELTRGSLLMRTPSRLENMRKARELRQTLKKEKPVPMGSHTAKMLDEMKSTDERKDRIFYSDDGGIRATHEDGAGGDQIYYLGVIDCLTHYGFLKRVEHFWKGMSHPRNQISPIPPEQYGDRFINFITGITMTREEAERRQTMDGFPDNRASVDAHNMAHHHHIPSPINTNVDGLLSADLEGLDSASPRSPAAVEKTMRKAQRQVDKSTAERGHPNRKSAEEEVPDRVVKPVPVPDDNGQQIGQPRTSTTLPVVQEVGEGSSDISHRSRSRSRQESASTHRMDRRESDIGAQESNTEYDTLSADTEKRSSDKAAHRRSEFFESYTVSHEEPPEEEPTDAQLNAAFLAARRDKAPRLESGIIPHLAPMYDSPDVLDPEKSVLGPDGEPIPNVEKLPGLAVITEKEGRHTVR